MKVDLPEFGLPRIATFLPSGTSMELCIIFFSSTDFSSLRFNECSELISIKSLIPFFSKSTFIDDFDFLSSLFKTLINRLFNFLNLDIIS